MKALKTLVALAALSPLAVIAPVQAQDAATLDELLDIIERGRVSEREEARQREARFRAQQAEQERLLAEARQQKAEEEARSERLEAQYQANETKIAEEEARLTDRLGSLRELFGVLQQVASDTSGSFEASLTSVQFPDRSEFLDELNKKMGSASSLAEISEIERLRFELLREARESGRVARFNTPVVIDGQLQDTEVVRVGVFNIVSDGRYLKYEPATDTVSELQRQPQQARFTGSTSDLVNAEAGFASFGLDPTKGQILGLLVDSPTLVERVQQGGNVGYVILGLGAIAVLLAVFRFVILFFTSMAVSSQLKNPSEIKKSNPLGRVLSVAESNPDADQETLELKLSEAIMHETPKINFGLLPLKVISVVAPLLGLLGTVVGMIVTFQAITLFGTGDPKLMAGGISQALVTTVLGLVVAIPTVLLHTFVSGRAKSILHVLQEQSAGVLAERSEQQL
jgi:biopolymer transport protein ExbB